MLHISGTYRFWRLGVAVLVGLVAIAVVVMARSPQVQAGTKARAHSRSVGSSAGQVAPAAGGRSPQTSARPSAATGSGYVNYVTTQPEYTDGPNFICTGPDGGSIDCIEDTVVSFSSPISDLTFNAIGVNDTGQVAEFDLFGPSGLIATVPEIGNASGTTSELQDLSSYSNVTELVIYDITDGGGIGWGDFSFIQNGAPTEIDFNTLPQGGITGVVVTNQFPSATFCALAASTTDSSVAPKCGGLIAAFGDSYAAGEGDPAPGGLTGASCSTSPSAAYCGYDSGNWTDSTDAYPNVLAGQLGDSVDNFAISGACASTFASNTTHLPNCGSTRPSVLGSKGELASAATLNLHPSLVTLTIGGNDVNFESCFTNVFGVPAINGAPCSDSTDAIAQIQSNVTKVLKKINQLYPGVPIVVTEYADPLPKVFSGKNPNSLCSQHALIYAAYEGAVLGKVKSAIATWVSNDHDGAGIKYLNSAYSKAQSITQALGNALNAAVTTAVSSGVNAHAVALNFASHGLCQDYPGGNAGWLLAPSVKLVVHTLGVVNKTYSYVASDTCAYADGGCSQFGPKIVSGSYLGIKYKLTLSANINDLPHPTIAGQQAIASQLMPEVTTLLGTG
jgi:lysophospholipase L1-like esterase